MCINIIALGERKMRRIRFVIIRLKGQRSVNSLSQVKERKKKGEKRRTGIESDLRLSRCYKSKRKKNI